jgi:tripartite-type tricarboxylate transporter receptor subunit TctC
MGKQYAFSVVLAGAALFVAAMPAQAQAWQPDRNVEIVINTAPGSGQDSTGRLIQKILQERKAVPTSLTVVNKPGAAARSPTAT